MLIRKAYKQKLKTRLKERTIFSKAVGCNRFVWNYFLAKNLYYLENGMRIMSYVEMNWFLTNFLKKSEEYKFLKDAHSQTLQQTLKNLERAFKDWFDKSQPKKKKPRFKSRGKCKDNGVKFPQGVKVDGNRVYIPKIGWIRFFKSYDIKGTIKNLHLLKESDGWYISIQVEYEELILPRKDSSSVGADWGVKNFVTMSDGTVFKPNDSLEKYERKLRIAQRAVSRKQKGSKNKGKSQKKVAKIHKKIANCRNDHIHKSTTTICKNHTLIVIEDLNVANMSKSAKGDIDNPGKNVKAKSGLNKSILNQAPYEFRRQLEYKSTWYGSKVQAVDPKYSSQTCSSCGYKSKENRKTQEKFVCVECGFSKNADINAAINLLNRGRAALVSPTDINANVSWHGGESPVLALH